MPKRVLNALKKIARLMAVLFMTAMFVSFLLQIFMRYIVNRPLDWTVEACVLFYIWTVFWAAAFLVPLRDHVAFTMLYDAMPVPRRRILAIASLLCIGLAFGASLPAVIDYITFMRIDVTPVTKIRFDYAYSVFVLFVVSITLQALLSVKRLLGRHWRQELAAERAGSDSA